MKTVSIIGIGRIGGGLAAALAHKGYCHRKSHQPKSGRNFGVLIAELPETPRIRKLEQAEFDCVGLNFYHDTGRGNCKKTAQLLAAKLNYKPCVFHTSGALSSEILDDLKIARLFDGFDSSVGFD